MNKAAQALGKLGGKAKSEAKTRAARANARKPRKIGEAQRYILEMRRLSKVRRVRLSSPSCRVGYSGDRARFGILQLRVLAYYRCGRKTENRTAQEAAAESIRAMNAKLLPVPDIHAGVRIRVKPTGRRGKQPVYAAKIGTHGSTGIIVKRSREFTVDQRIEFAEFSSMHGTSIGCTPQWRTGRIWKVEDDRIFVSLI